MKLLIDALDPTRKQRLAAAKQAELMLSRLGIQPDVKLNEHEMLIASQLVDPASVQVRFEDIAGHGDLIQELRQTVILPIQKRELFVGSDLMMAPRGVLLHGPPGCGKTMCAKATAREAQARFINLDISSLTDKWYGESQKIAGAVFTLAKKIQPCIIFIDEIDSLLRVRSQQDHEATSMIKAQFLQLWDGLATDKDNTVVVMGATNRPRDVDSAILRRMPATFRLGLPDMRQRREIISAVLKLEKCDDSLDLLRLAKLTEGYSGSDLRELCRAAAVYRVRDLEDDDTLRPINMEDMLSVLAKMRESRVNCGIAVGGQPDLD